MNVIEICPYCKGHSSAVVSDKTTKFHKIFECNSCRLNYGVYKEYVDYVKFAEDHDKRYRDAIFAPYDESTKRIVPELLRERNALIDQHKTLYPYKYPIKQ
jgi:hypothetical protein